MILYFADRGLNILGMASTELDGGAIVENDRKTGDLETGIQSFEFTIHWDEINGIKTRPWTTEGNYVFRFEGDEVDCFTITEVEEDTLEETSEVYAEDAGLDLLNEISLPYEAQTDHPVEFYVKKFAYDSGFEMGVNEIPERSRKLKWDGEMAMAERIASVAKQFDAEFSFGFEFDGLRLVRKTINILKRRGEDAGVQLRMNHEVNRIVIKKNINNVATALYVTGGTPEEAEDPITLAGYQIPASESENGNFFLDGPYLKSTRALRKWSRYLNPSEPSQTYTGHIMKTYSYDTTSQAELCTRAINALKAMEDAEVNYEVELVDLPTGIRLGDTVTVVDKKNAIQVTARIIKLETSVVDKTHTATIGEYIRSDE